MRWKNRALIFIYFIFFILFSINSSAVDIDKSLFEGKSKTLIAKYENLLAKTESEKKTNSEYAIQKSLICSIINILKYPTKIGFDFPQSQTVKNQYDYLAVLKNISAMKVRYSNIKHQMDDVEKKLDALGATITDAKDNNDKVFSYQLQYAFYSLTQKGFENEITYLENHFQKWEDELYKLFKKTYFDDKIPQSKLKSYTAKYNDIDNYIQKLNIENDRLALLNRSTEQEAVADKLNDAVKKRDSAVNSILDNYALIFLYSLKQKDNIEPIDKNIYIWSKKLKSEKDKKFAEQEHELLYRIAQMKLGHTRLLIQYVRENITHAFVVAWSFVNKPIFQIGDSYFSVSKLIFAVFIFVFGVYIGRFYKSRIIEASLIKTIPLSTKTIVSNIGYYIIIITALFSGLRIVGINLSSLTVIFGALSVGVGFGLQNMVANVISGIILMIENSIRIGDYVEITDNLKGEIKDIRMRSTTILTNDNIEVIVPNQTLFQNNVINWTLTERVRRYRIPFSVAYGTDIENVKKAVYGALEKSNLDFIRDIPGKKPELKMISMASSSVDFELDVWVAGMDVIYPRRTTSKFLIMIYNALYENNIEIPFPQMDLHIKHPVKINTKKDD